jgi:hypothetical protein
MRGDTCAGFLSMGMTKSLTGQSTSGIWFRYLKSARVQVWWCTPVISALGRLKQEDLEFEANLDYRVRPCLKKKKKSKTK